MADFLLYERDGPVVTLTMNQPEVRNAVTGNTAVPEFVAACEKITADLSIRAVIIAANGTVFSSGGNVKDMLRFTTNEISPASLRQWYVTGIQLLTKALYNLEVPTIAAINGPAIGVGCDLACMCDFRIASDKATFAESFIRVGIIPGDGGAWLLPRTVGMTKAMEMAFTGDPITAAEALECGLVSKITTPEDLLPSANELAKRIVKNPGNVLRMTKRLMRESQTSSLDAILHMSVGMQVIAHKSPAHLEAINAFIEKRTPNFADE
jgi:enoyl-CoA hydratase/carnithine racemase